jgi:hypothetical protein
MTIVSQGQTGLATAEDARREREVFLTVVALLHFEDLKEWPALSGCLQRELLTEAAGLMETAIRADRLALSF